MEAFDDIDPFDWTVDQVTQYLCRGSFDSWTRSAIPLPRPDPTLLEHALRENDVTGEILLTEVNKQTLAQDFGVKSLGQRATLFLAIQYLQKLSPKYQQLDQRWPGLPRASRSGSYSVGEPAVCMPA